MCIDEQIKLDLNGAMQYVSIRSENQDAPLLLYIHGGPGDAALPLVLKYNSVLEKQFTVVVWEQRGAGKSYYHFGDHHNITMDIFVQDACELIKILLMRYHQEKLYLLGHSWGSVLGLKIIQRHPEMVHAYVGIGQVVNMKKTCQLAYQFALEHAEPKALERLRQIDCTYTTEGWLQDLLFVTGQVVKHKGSLYGKTNYNTFMKSFLLSKHYSLLDLIRRQRGSLQSIQRLWPALMQTDFEGQTQYAVPTIFVEGRYDSHVSSTLAFEYYQSIQSEKQFFWFEESCHFPQWSESAKFNQLIMDLFCHN